MRLEQSLMIVEQHLSVLDDPQFNQIDFEWQHMRFHAHSEEIADQKGRIILTGRLGRLHYTIENADYRALAIDCIYTNNRRVDGAYTIADGGEVTFKSLTQTNRVLGGQDFLTAVTTIMLEAGNHLREVQAFLKAKQAIKTRRAAA